VTAFLDEPQPVPNGLRLFLRIKESAVRRLTKRNLDFVSRSAYNLSAPILRQALHQRKKLLLGL